MTLEEVRKMIDCVDTQIKPLFLERMACAEHVAAAKAETVLMCLCRTGRMRLF